MRERERWRDGVHGAVTRAQAQLVEQARHEELLGSTGLELDQWSDEKLSPNKSVCVLCYSACAVSCAVRVVRVARGVVAVVGGVQEFSHHR
jgi:ferredoxin